MLKEICWEYDISDVTFYNWKAKYDGMQASDIKKLKALEEKTIASNKCIRTSTLTAKS